jgi:stage V sporulation protein AB
VAWLAALVALGEGLVVGTALASFLVVLGVVPRLARLTGSERWVRAYEAAIGLGAFAGACLEARPVRLGLPAAAAAVPSLAMGLFVGMVSAALAEVIDVLPILRRRLAGPGRWLRWLVLALAAGKTLGSVLWWTFPRLFERPPAG